MCPFFIVVLLEKYIGKEIVGYIVSKERVGSKEGVRYSEILCGFLGKFSYLHIYVLLFL